MKKTISIYCTLGPSSLNAKFLKFAEKNKVSLVRLNLSHLTLKNLQENLKYIKKNSKLNICVDTEGAQIRTKTKITKPKLFRKNQSGVIYNKYQKGFALYPSDVFYKIKVGDILDIGFEGLKIKINQKNQDKILFKVLSPGLLEGNKGVHILNRKIKLNYLTDKDLKAIQIAKKYKIKNFALSFTNSYLDIINFKNLLKKENKIYKIETKQAVKNLDKMLKYGNNFLIDRGDLSKDITIESIPLAQRLIISKAKKMNNKNIFIATNFLESMIKNSSPTRAEANDIYNSIEMGCAGIVLAAETAIGKYPMECVTFVNKIIKKYKNKKKKIF